MRSPRTVRCVLAGLCALVIALSACTTRSTSTDGSPTPTSDQSQVPDVTSTALPETPVPPGQPEVVQADQRAPNPHPVSVTRIDAALEEGRAVARPVWWSGVEPCNILQRVEVVRAEYDVTLTVYEGGRTDAVCVELAVEKTTPVDLGALPPGTYTITADDPEATTPGPQAELTVP